ncbi:hypothetical protein OGH69_04115 [Flavobacterium sp. MFBS3-15]|uniref:hypothetical protein n=1 Tax=Flavobacterium sp. MFBS3-15 TaxID=2989816 RepID=UPI002235E769|nr:hypothetical protein [Flavobacterium sp. MFBS3-15]MCW4468141.1 hypothetical protein [Flavobacterium sp. MFBS3-15]
MNSFKKIAAIVLLAVMASQAVTAATNGITVAKEAVGGYFDVYLINNCSKEIEVRVRADGSSSTSKYKAGEKVKVPVKAGYEVYVDGKLFKKFEDSDSGKEIKLCK